MRLTNFAYLPLIGWFIISTFLLTMPGDDLPSEDWFSDISLDLWIHAGMFLGMVFLWCWALFKTKGNKAPLLKSFVWITVACLAYGITMEFIQLYFIVNRNFSYSDISADAA
ncbi:MAG TPA: VanZ family protein, partial [Chitinophagaceae bacterium]|nr:VanZ family protein [Chitinophagaceae bacterium]